MKNYLPDNFFNYSPEKQAEWIEKQTTKLLKRLDALKENLQLYNDVSDEMYNLSQEEVELQSEVWKRAVRGGEITTPSSKRAYQQFVANTAKFAKMSMIELTRLYASNRIDSFLETIRKNGSIEEYEYAKSLVDSMSEDDKVGFTKSKYFLDVDNWGSEGFTFKGDDGYEYSIMTMKLELYLKTRGNETSDIYNKTFHSDEDISTLRPSTRGGKVRKRRSKL